MPLQADIVKVRIGGEFIDSNGQPIVGKLLRILPTETRYSDNVAQAVIYGVQATSADGSVPLTDPTGAAFVEVVASDTAGLDRSIVYSVLEPDGKTAYFVDAPSTAPVDAVTGMPTIDLYTAQHVPPPAEGILQIMQGPTGLSLIVAKRAPTADDGVDGQGFIDSAAGMLYGPKTAGVWGTGLSLAGGGSGTPGLGIASVDLAPNGHLTVTYSDTTTHDAGLVKSVAGFAFDTGTPPHLIATYIDGSTQDLGDLGGSSGGSGITSINGDPGPAVTLAPYELSPPAPTQSARPVNVRDQANPLANAVMDGGSHLLSSRFTSLSDAQAVFPAATALTQEIDTVAIQNLLATAPKVYLSYGTALVDSVLNLLPGGNQEVEGEGPNITVLKLKNGINQNVLQSGDQTNTNPNTTLRRFSVNGNSPNNTGPIGQTDGILLVRCDDLRLEDLEVHHVNGRGIHHHGLTGSTVENQFWNRVYAYNCQHWGIWNTNGVRIVDYKSIFAINCGLRTDIGLSGTGNAADSFTGGMLLDHSEATASGIHCIGNGQDGLWIRNAFACNLNEIIANRNGRHGVRVLGLVDSLADSWLIQSNGQNAALTAHNVFMDGTGTLNYGVTARTKMTNIEAGPNQASTIATQGAWPADGTDYAVWLDDNMANSDLDASFKVYAGSAGAIRYPSAGLGSLRVNDGSGLERVERFDVSGTAVQLGDINTGQMKRIVLTANCDITLPAAGAGKVISVKMIQDATGSRTWTFHPADGVSGHMKYAGGTTPTPTTTAGSGDEIAWECDDGVHWLGHVKAQNI